MVTFELPGALVTVLPMKKTLRGGPQMKDLFVVVIIPDEHDANSDSASITDRQSIMSVIMTPSATIANPKVD